MSKEDVAKSPSGSSLPLRSPRKSTRSRNSSEVYKWISCPKSQRMTPEPRTNLLGHGMKGAGRDFGGFPAPETGTLKTT